ncbi:MAG: hypothetical protein ACLQJR_20410 [Stellaceae bacterium]
MNAKLAVPGFVNGIAVPAELATPAVHREIIDFLDGRSNGAALMLSIYGDLADETLPPRLAALLQGWRATRQ